MLEAEPGQMLDILAQTPALTGVICLTVFWLRGVRALDSGLRLVGVWVAVKNWVDRYRRVEAFTADDLVPEMSRESSFASKGLPAVNRPPVIHTYCSSALHVIFTSQEERSKLREEKGPVV